VTATKTHSAAAVRELGYVALIADMVGSKTVGVRERTAVQRRFSEFVNSLNREFEMQLKAKFIITLGDEFQGILNDVDAIPDLIWILEEEFQDRRLRIGFGFGKLTTDVPEYAINLDGPALHRARAAIDIAKKENWLGGVFAGFGTQEDLVLNGLARLLRFQRQRLKRQQRRVLSLLREGNSQVAIAKELEITPQAVSTSQNRAGWDAYRQGEAGLSAMLELLRDKLEKTA
jgi:hypothetical protein